MTFKAKKETPTKPTLEDAQRIIAEAETARRKECIDKIAAILAEYGYALDVSRPQIVIGPAKAQQGL